MIGRFVAHRFTRQSASRGRVRTSLLPAGAIDAPIILVALGMAAHAQNTAPPANPAAGTTISQQVPGQVSIPLPSLSPLVERVAPAVVNVSVALSDHDGAQRGSTSREFPPSPFDEFLRRFFEQQGIPNRTERAPRMPPRAPQAVALGSGFVIDDSGDIVTNNHVVGDADEVTVILQDNSRHAARIVGRDEQTDVALLKIDTDKKLPFVTWGDSDRAKVGDWVVAVGNPFGLGGTVTAGIISALGRNIEAGPYDDFLQIDASINRGNSGGPTFSLTGEVLGINTAIYSPSGGSVGIGFALPANLAKNVVAQLKDHGHVVRGWLGVQAQNITPEIAKSLGLDPDSAKGALVAGVSDNSPAAKAGLKPGDVITRFAGKEIKSAHDLPRLVAETPVGQQVDLTVLRNGREQPLQVAVGEAPEPAKAAMSDGGPGDQARPRQKSAFGMRLSPLTDETRDLAGLPKDATVDGVVVVAVDADSPATGAVAPGDVIISINQEPVTDPAQAASSLKDAAAKDQALLLVNHQGTNRFIGVALGGHQD